MGEATKTKIYGGFVNLAKGFNIYEYDALDMHDGSFVLEVYVPITTQTSNNILNASQLNKKLEMADTVDNAPWHNFVFYSKSKDLVEDTLKDYRKDIIHYYKGILEHIEHTSINDKGLVKL